MNIASSSQQIPMEELKPKKKVKVTDQLKGPSLPLQSYAGPLPTLLLDNGGWTIKHALLKPNSTSDTPQMHPTLSQNLSAKPKHQLTTLFSSQINSIHNKSQLVISRPLERGYIVDLGTQFQIWDYILELENLNPKHSFSNYSTVTAKDLVKPTASKRSSPIHDGLTFTHTSAVFLLMQPFTPRCIIEKEDECWFRDFGFARVGRRLGACCSAYKYLQDGKTASRGGSEYEDDDTGCCLVVDCGFSMTSIVPTVHAQAIEKGIKRINIGGKLLTNLLKQVISYRKFNMMDEFFLVNDAKEALSFVSMNFDHEMKDARGKQEGRRWFDRDFVLPNFVDTFTGSVRLPSELLLEKKIEENQGKDGEESKIEEYNRNEENVADNEEDDGENDDDENDDDSDEETEEQAKRRILKQRQEEQKRRELEEMERQVLSVSTERFTVPEILFRPSDIGIEYLGITEAIVQSINACDPIYRAALYQNIVLTGGTMKIPNLKERLEQELRSLAPTNYKVRVYLPNDPVEYAWSGANSLINNNDNVGNVFLDRSEWETSKNKKLSTGVIWSARLNQGMDSGFTVV
jgi:actin-related protein 6